MTNAERTYRGPIIERTVERGVLNGNAETSPSSFFDYALAVDDGTGEIVVIILWGMEKWGISGSNRSAHFYFHSWTVTP